MDLGSRLVRNPRVFIQPPLRQPASQVQVPASGVLVDVVVLSAEMALFEAIRNAIGERNPVWRARSAEESVDLLLTGRCGVLVVDMGAVSIEATTLIEQIVEQFPDVVIVVAGRREDEARLARLVSDGLIYRFMHKPLSAKRAGMFLGASIRHHVERRESRAPEESILPGVARLPARVEPRKWLFVAIGLGVFVAALAAFLGGHGREPARAEKTATTRIATPAPRAAGPLADPVLSRARAAFAGGRYESPAGRNALDLYAAVLLARPDHAEARAGLDKTVERVIAQAEHAADTGRETEADRLLQRVLAVDPRNDAAATLAQRLAPSPTTAAPNPTPAPAPAAAAAPATLVTTTPRVPPTTPIAARATQIVTPDPLTPRVVNADAMRQSSATRLHATRVFGPPIASGHPIAGYVKPAPAAFTPDPAAPSEGPAAASAAVDAIQLPSDEFQPLVATNPVYPADALRNRVEGWVEMEFTITETGTVSDIEVLGAEPRGTFEAAATETLGAWRFKPRVANGQPVPQRSVVTLRFNLDD